MTPKKHQENHICQHLVTAKLYKTPTNNIQQDTSDGDVVNPNQKHVPSEQKFIQQGRLYGDSYHMF